MKIMFWLKQLLYLLVVFPYRIIFMLVPSLRSRHVSCILFMLCSLSCLLFISCSLPLTLFMPPVPCPAVIATRYFWTFSTWPASLSHVTASHHWVPGWNWSWVVWVIMTATVPTSVVVTSCWPRAWLTSLLHLTPVVVTRTQAHEDRATRFAMGSRL